MKRISAISRILVAAAAFALVITYFVPVWRIDLFAPQYPEGLNMRIWLNKLSGDVEIINGLNHYIGMKHIKVEMFPEFGFLIYVVAFYILFGVAVAVTASRRLLAAYFGLMVLGGLAALADFYRWGYDYGHNLDPNAAIQVPGMTYQPPVVGYKQLLNFEAWSLPDVGGWVFIVAGIITAAVLVYEWFFRRTRISAKSLSVSVMALVLVFGSAACAVKSEPLQFGKDNCHFCKMGISDRKFGAELVTKKGKIYKFDDLNCMMNFQKTGEVQQADIAQTLVVDYAQNGQLIPVESAYFLSSSDLRSPMNGNIAAFENKKELDKVKSQLNGVETTWQAIAKTGK